MRLADFHQHVVPVAEAEGWVTSRHPPVDLDLGGGKHNDVQEGDLARVVIERAHPIRRVPAEDRLVPALRRVGEPAQESVVHVHLNVPPEQETIHPERLHDRVVPEQVAPRRRCWEVKLAAAQAGDQPDIATWYREHAEELFPIYRDMPTMPPSSQETMRSENRRLGDLLVADDVPVGDPGRKMRAVARHLVDYRTWRSLAIQQELSDAEAVEIGVRLLIVLAATPRARRRAGVTEA